MVTTIEVYKGFLLWLEKTKEATELSKYIDYCRSKEKFVISSAAKNSKEEISEITRALNRYLDEFNISQDFYKNINLWFDKIESSVGD